MILYGLRGFTHNGAKVLTVMGPEGAAATLRALEGAEDVAVIGGAGRLTQVHEKRRGALKRLIEDHGITVLSKAEWDAKKAELGAAVLR